MLLTLLNTKDTGEMRTYLQLRKSIQISVRVHPSARLQEISRNPFKTQVCLATVQFEAIEVGNHASCCLQLKYLSQILKMRGKLRPNTFLSCLLVQNKRLVFLNNINRET